MLGCLPLIHCIEVETGVVVFYGLEVRSENVFYALPFSNQRLKEKGYIEGTIFR